MKRGLLLIAGMAICATGVSSPRAAETELEVAGYEGNTTGGWACGPQASVRYGGLAAELRHAERKVTPEQGVGMTLALGAAVEVARARIDAEPISEASDEWEATAPPGAFSDVFGAGNARVGYHARHFGIEGGMMMWSGWKEPRKHGMLVFPELLLSFGPRDFLYAEAGIGVPTSTWLMRPAFPYVTVGLSPSDQVRLEFHGGTFRDGPGLLGGGALMFDGAGYVTIHRRWDLRGSLAFGTELTDRQASLGFVYRL